MNKYKKQIGEDYYCLLRTKVDYPGIFYKYLVKRANLLKIDKSMYLMRIDDYKYRDQPIWFEQIFKNSVRARNYCQKLNYNTYNDEINRLTKEFRQSWDKAK